MGGYGSGRHSDQLKIEECTSLDANQLRRDGCLNNGWNGTCRWSHNDVEVGSVVLRMSADHLHLAYRSRGPGREWEEVNQPVLIERVPCRFGGWRPYFRCRCNRRVVKLYSEGRLFLCRHCYNLPYSSKNEGFWDRSLRKRDKHRVRLSGNASTEAFETLKPKGMWWRTYHRLHECAQAAERRAEDDFLVAARRLLKMG
jgi:hypothetical protein